MKRVKIFKASKVIVILFLILSAQVSHSQNSINIKKCDPNNTFRLTILKILDSQDITNLNSRSGSINNNSIVEINYSTLSSINVANLSTIKYVIIKVTEDITALNLNLLNRFPSLQIIHFIVEKPISENTLEDIFNSSNNNWTITYQIEIPQ